MLYRKVIGNGYVSLAITESLKDDYVLLESLSGDDPPVTTIGKLHYLVKRMCKVVCGYVSVE